jgi:hypothetical protein
VAALNTAMRDVSGRGVLYRQAIAERLGINSTDLECRADATRCGNRVAALWEGRAGLAARFLHGVQGASLAALSELRRHTPPEGGDAVAPRRADDADRVGNKLRR